MRDIQPVDTKYIWAHSYHISQIWKPFKQSLVEGYPWLMGTYPKIFDNVLITPIVHQSGLDKMLDELNYLKSSGDHSFLMFDSGGFQVGTPTNDITPANIVERNLYLYNTYDKADAYVLADVGINLRQTEQQQTENVKKTIKLTRELYERLPERIQVKCVPVYQVNKKEHIDMQFESHGKISQISGMACYSIPAPPKRLTFEHMKWIMYLKSLQPNTKIHLLGTTAQPAFFAMRQIGIDSCDSISPIWQGGNGTVATYFDGHVFSHRKTNDSVDKSVLIEANERTGHRCPFCEESKINELKTLSLNRRIHNLIVFSELSAFYKQFSFEEYKTLSSQTAEWAVTLEKALDSNIPVPKTTAPTTSKNNPVVDNDTPTQLTLF